MLAKPQSRLRFLETKKADRQRLERAVNCALELAEAHGGIYVGEMRIYKYDDGGVSYLAASYRAPGSMAPMEFLKVNLVIGGFRVVTFNDPNWEHASRIDMVYEKMQRNGLMRLKR
jgi:hypothetical protein